MNYTNLHIKKFHSTETALLKVFNDIACELDDKKVVLLSLLDLSAAFDTIDHTILLNRLNISFGIQGTALEWFKSYLFLENNVSKLAHLFLKQHRYVLVYHREAS